MAASNIDYSTLPSTVSEWVYALTAVDTGNIDCVHPSLRQFVVDEVTPDGWLKRPYEGIKTPFVYVKWHLAFDDNVQFPWKGTGWTPDDIRAQWETEDALAAVEAERHVAAELYFIGADEGPIKIGVSQNVEKRLKQLQTAHPHRLRILAVLVGGALREGDYHARFAEHRLEGEWFERAPAILAEIERLLA